MRDDGSFEQASLGPRLTYHDLAYFVAESIPGICDGFYGNSKKGFSVEQLSDKEIIKKLGTGPAVVEVVARNLQLFGSAACTKKEFQRSFAVFD